MLILKKDQGNVLTVHVSGKLVKSDYESLVPTVESLIRAFGKIRILFVMEDFKGWSAGALWEDVKFDVRHFADIERLAMVGDKGWQKGMSVFCKPFTKADVRFFEKEQMAEAAAWLQE